MSDLGLQSPYAPGSPEEQQYNKGMLRGFTVPASNMPVGALSQLLPDPNAHGVEAVIPGAASGLYSTIDTVQRLGQHYIGGVPLAATTHIPGGEESGKLSEGSHELAARLIPHQEPQNAAEEIAANIGDTAGAVGLGLPGGVASKLPLVVRGLAHAALPGPRAIAPAIVASGAANALIDHAQAQDNPTNDGQGLGLFDDPTPGIKQGPTSQTTQPPVNDGQGLGLFDTPTQPLPQVTPPTQDGQGLGVFDRPATEAETDPSTMTWGTFLFGTAVTGAVLLGGRRVSRFGIDLAKTKYFDDTARINTNAAANGGVVTDQVPLPGTAQSGVTSMRQSALDSGAVAKEFLKSTADTPLIGEQLQAKYGDITSTQASVQRYQAGTEAGELHGQKMPPLKEWYQDVAKLTPDQKELLNTGLHYGNEIDNRFANFNEMSRSGTLPTDAQTRVNFTGKDLSELHTGLNAALADPQVKALIDTNRLHSDAMVDMMVRNGQLAVGEGQAMKTAHKYFVASSDLDNIITNPMNSRERTPYSGSSTFPDVSQLKDQHAYALYKMVDDNNARDMIITNGLNFQNNKGGAPLIQESRDPTTGAWIAKKDGSSLPVRRGNQLEHYIINNRQFLDALKAPSVQLGAALGAINKIRQVSQSGMTGVLSVLSGHFFPAINAKRSAGEISVLRPKGMYGGHIDKLLQQATGGKLALRGDPTGYIGTTYHIIADPAAEIVRAIGELYAPKATNAINVRMRSLLGDKAFDAISKRAMAVYEQSNRAAMREQGMLSSAGYTGNDVTSRTIGNKADFMAQNKGAMMPSWDMVPENFQVNRLGGAMPTYVRLKSLFNELKGSIGDAAHSNFFAMNKDNPHITPEQLRYETRNITGDPGTHGASAGAKGYGSVIPFGNVAMQEGARVLRSFNEAPIATTLGYLTHYGALAAASVFSAMLAGPQAVQHLFDQTTDREKSADAHLYIPSQPTNPIRIPLQINMRGPYPFMVQMFHDIFSLPSHADDPNWASRVQDMFLDFFSKHVHQSTINSAVEGVSGGLPPLLPAGVGGASIALTGKQLDPTLGAAYMHADKPLNEKFSYDISGEHGSRTPGTNPGRTDPITGTVDGNIMQHVISDVFASAGIMMLSAIKDYHNVTKAGGDIGEVAHHVMQEYKLRLADSVPGLNVLWNVPEKLQANTPLQEKVEEYLDKMRREVTWKSDMSTQGFTRKQGQPLAVPLDDPNTPQDPIMKGMYVTAGRYMELLNSKPGSPLKVVQDDRKQLQALERSPMDPVQLREARNGYVKDMQEQYQKTMAYIHMMNADLSKQAGVPVDLRHIDFKKGPEQFAPAPQ